MITTDGTIAADAANGFDCWGDAREMAAAGDLGADDADGRGNRVDVVAKKHGATRADVLSAVIRRAAREFAGY